MKRIVNKHPLAIRWFHWINFPVLTIMIWSGLLIYWANDVYRLGWGNKTLIKFFPQSFYDALHVPFHLSTGMAFHFFFMWFFFLNGVLYVLYTIFSGEWRYLLPNRKSFKEAWLVVLHDLHIRKGLPQQKKYNAAQRIAYSAIIVMGFGSIVTGLAVYKPIQFNWLCVLCGGYEAARVEHFALTIGYVLFFLVHVVQVIIAGWNNFQAMVTGFEVESKDEREKESDRAEEKSESEEQSDRAEEIGERKGESGKESDRAEEKSESEGQSDRAEEICESTGESGKESDRAEEKSESEEQSDRAENVLPAGGPISEDCILTVSPEDADMSKMEEPEPNEENTKPEDDTKPTAV